MFLPEIVGSDTGFDPSSAEHTENICLVKQNSGVNWMILTMFVVLKSFLKIDNKLIPIQVF